MPRKTPEKHKYMQNIQQTLGQFISELLVYDYILFGCVLIIFILLIVVAILLRRRLALALFIIFLSFSFLVGGSIFGYIELHKYLFKNSVEVTKQKKLNFTEAAVVYAKFTNESNRFFSKCKINATAYMIDENKIKELILKLKPIQKMSIIEENIDINETRELKIIIEPFTYKYDFNVSIKADCK